MMIGCVQQQMIFSLSHPLLSITNSKFIALILLAVILTHNNNNITTEAAAATTATTARRQVNIWSYRRSPAFSCRRPPGLYRAGNSKLSLLAHHTLALALFRSPVVSVPQHHRKDILGAEGAAVCRIGFLSCTTTPSTTTARSLTKAAVLHATMTSTTSSSANDESTAATTTTTDATMTNDIDNMKHSEDFDDPYLWLEEVESEQSLDFARKANEACLLALGDPKESISYQQILAVLESDDRIPFVTQMGFNNHGQPVLFNFWKDAQNPKGLWRRTTMDLYRCSLPSSTTTTNTSSSSTEWETILNVDELAQKDNISWVWKGSRSLPRSLDPVQSQASDSTYQMVSRALLSLSRGGSDAVHIKEFDLITNDFVMDEPFHIPEAKTRASYKSRNVLLVGTDCGPDSLTESGYPRTVREWVRGTNLVDAPIVFEGDKKDVSVEAHISDERIWGGGIYEMRSRSLTFYTSKHWARKVQYEHLLAPNDPARQGISDPPPFVEIDIQEDASISFHGNMAIISLRSDWEPVPGDRLYKKGSVIYCDADTLLLQGSKGCVYTILFEPTDRTAYEYYTATKNYLIVATIDNVKSKLEFYKIQPDGKGLIRVGDNTEARIRECSVSPVDPYTGSDEFWFTTSDFVTPSTLYLADASKVEEKADEKNNNSLDIFIGEKLRSLPDQYDATNIQIKQMFATSTDGTSIPYFLIMNKDTVLDGTNPTLLYGYGGFEVSLGPHYIATAGLAWLERGGVYVEANIRGGGEFGPSWHQAALKSNRNKCYEDFIAVAEHLIQSNICTPQTLAIRGGSNGGLLMGNMYIMRPDLFGAIHCAVPLLDMKRYHKLLAGASWMAEYGDPDTDDWLFLEKYSPYHNIDINANYPPILVTTSTRDDRVHPAHARKWVKKLWDMGQGRWPVYYYENIEGGHGGAADAKQTAFMTALAYDFMFETLSNNKKNKE